MNRSMSLRTVANTHAWVEPDALRGRKRVVGVDEATLRTFDMLKRKRIGNPTELERVWLVERCGIKNDDAVPAALHWHRLTCHNGVAGCL